MTITDSEVAIDLDLPPDFHEVPFGPSVEDRVFGQSQILDRLHIADPAHREGLGWYLEALSRGVSEGAVAGTAFCAVRLDGAPSTATITVATHPAASDDPLVFVLGACRTFRDSGRYEAVQHERLGRTLAAVASGATANARNLTIAVPVPGHRTGVVLMLSTTDTAHTVVYEQVARDAAASVRVPAPRS
ncbi:MAG: hypothetical protein ACRDO8_11925 [Nocardioidaceae bacterium]